MAASDQHGFDIRFEWGPQGLDALLAGGVRTVVIVDVLRFSTAVDVACGRGAAVTPWPTGEGAAAEAARRGALVAQPSPSDGDTSQPSLSPVSLRNLQPPDHVLLPSPNGATLACRAAAAGGVVVLAACLRNATAVAEAVPAFPLGVVAAGERWPDGSLRPAVEDAWGAGAVIAALAAPAGPDAALGLLALFGEALQPAPAGAGQRPSRSLSPEAAWAAAGVPDDLAALLPRTASGRLLDDAGWSLDIEVAAARDVSRTVPRLDGGGTFRA